MLNLSSNPRTFRFLMTFFGMLASGCNNHPDHAADQIAETRGGAVLELNCSPYIKQGVWILRSDGDNAGQLSLKLTPTACGRQITRTAEVDHMFAEIVRKYGDERYFSNPRGMLHQLQCHLDNASNNETWNLEPHRPDVGLTATKAALCNPNQAFPFEPPG